jgi:hypothetical protein
MTLRSRPRAADLVSWGVIGPEDEVLTIYREEAKKGEARANQFDDDRKVWLERERLWR